MDKMYTVEEIKDAFNCLAKDRKKYVLSLVNEYAATIKEMEHYVHSGAVEDKRNANECLITLHDQICSVMGIEHERSYRHIILEALKK